jgi:hypothetical protein
MPCAVMQVLRHVSIGILEVQHAGPDRRDGRDLCGLSQHCPDLWVPICLPVSDNSTYTSISQLAKFFGIDLGRRWTRSCMAAQPWETRRSSYPCLCLKSYLRRRLPFIHTRQAFRSLTQRLAARANRNPMLSLADYQPRSRREPRIRTSCFRYAQDRRADRDCSGRASENLCHQQARRSEGGGAG